MSKRRIVPLVSLLSLVFLVAAGCSGAKGSLASVTGKVMYGQTVVSAGNVTFIPAEGPPVPAGIKSDGTYTITDVAPGEYTVVVETESAKDKAMPMYGGGRGGDAKDPEGRRPPSGGSPKPSDFQGGGGTYVKIPDKYATKEKTTLKTTLSKGSNKYDINLTD